MNLLLRRSWCCFDSANWGWMFIFIVLFLRIAPENKEEMESSLEARFSCFLVNEFIGLLRGDRPDHECLPLEVITFWWKMVALHRFPCLMDQDSKYSKSSFAALLRTHCNGSSCLCFYGLIIESHGLDGCCC